MDAIKVKLFFCEEAYREKIYLFKLDILIMELKARFSKGLSDKFAHILRQSAEQYKDNWFVFFL